MRYPTLEHAYQVGKFHNPCIREIIFHQTSPWRAKEMAHEYGNKKREDWSEDVKLDFMRELIRVKTEQYFEIQSLLYHCLSLEISEESTDPFWGRQGRNWMGKLWMERKDVLYQKVPQ